MKFLIAGLGSIGRRHLRNLIALGEKNIILLRSHKSTLPDDELNGFPVETDLQTALQKHKPDAVIVANPTALHLKVAMPAAEAGCALLLEKPISQSLEGVEALQPYADKILVGFQFRYHPTLQKARHLIQRGALGQILAAHAHWGEYLPQWHPWEDYRASYAARKDLGGGVVATLSHPLDYLRFLLGEVKSLWAFSARVSPLEMDVEDAAEIGLEYSSGAIGSLHVNYVQRPPRHTLEIVGTRGTLNWNNADASLRFDSAPAPFGSYSENPPAIASEIFPAPNGFERNQLFLAQTRHFIEVANKSAAPICSLADGIRAQQLVAAVYQSAAQGTRIDNS